MTQQTKYGVSVREFQNLHGDPFHEAHIMFNSERRITKEESEWVFPEVADEVDFAECENKKQAEKLAELFQREYKKGGEIPKLKRLKLTLNS